MSREVQIRAETVLQKKRPISASRVASGGGGTQIKVQAGLTRDSYARRCLHSTVCGYVYDRHLPNYVWSGPLLRHAGINGSSVEGTVTHPRDSPSAKLWQFNWQKTHEDMKTGVILFHVTGITKK